MARVLGDAERPKSGGHGGDCLETAPQLAKLGRAACRVIVTVEIPVAAVMLAVSVKVLIVLVGVVGFVLNDAVRPFGRPDADKVAFPVKPFWGATVMVLEPLDP